MANKDICEELLGDMGDGEQKSGLNRAVNVTKKTGSDVSIHGNSYFP